MATSKIAHPLQIEGKSTDTIVKIGKTEHSERVLRNAEDLSAAWYPFHDLTGLCAPFHDLTGLCAALTPRHRSQAGLHLERLEWLGDSVLDMIAKLHIFEQYPSQPPGILTELASEQRIGVCTNDMFGYAAVGCGLHAYVTYSPKERQDMLRAARDLTKARAQLKKGEMTVEYIETLETEFSHDVKSLKKEPVDVFEAVMAAMLLENLVNTPRDAIDKVAAAAKH